MPTTKPKTPKQTKKQPSQVGGGDYSKILNPATGKHVQAGGAVGKKLIKNYKYDTIRNPATGKAVKVGGKIGESKLLQSSDNVKENKYTGNDLVHGGMIIPYAMDNLRFDMKLQSILMVISIWYNTPDKVLRITIDSKQYNYMRVESINLMNTTLIIGGLIYELDNSITKISSGSISTYIEKGNYKSTTVDIMNKTEDQRKAVRKGI